MLVGRINQAAGCRDGRPVTLLAPRNVELEMETHISCGTADTDVL